MTTLWLIVLCGVLAVIYAIWATRSVPQPSVSDNPPEVEVAVVDPDPAALAAAFERTIAPLLAQYCVRCHNAESPSGDINLAGWTPAAARVSSPALSRGRSRH